MVLMKKCRKYITLSDSTMRTSPHLNQREFVHHFKAFLFDYASQYWVWHVRDLDDEGWQRVQSVLKMRDAPFVGTYFHWIRAVVGDMSELIMLQTPPLYYAASFGLLHLARAILKNDKKVDLEARGGRMDSTALQVACFRRQLECATPLFRAGADPFSLDGTPLANGLSAFYWARTNNWSDLCNEMAASNEIKMRTHTKYELAYGLSSKPEQAEAEKVSYTAMQSMILQTSGPRTELDSVRQTVDGVWSHHFISDYRMPRETVATYLKQEFGDLDFHIRVSRLY